jgi:RHS repeat-associated protein
MVAGRSAGSTYDASGAMTALLDGNNEQLARFTYDPAGRRQGLALTWAGASTASYSYDPVGRLASLSHDLAGTAADQSLSFGYNPASQIVAKTASNDGYASNTAYNVARPYSVDGLNQYTAAGSASFAYDANGNLTSDGTNSFVYDAENRLVSRSGGVTLSYDPNGRLWQVSGPSSLTRFVYDGDRLIEELNGAGAWVRLYAHGAGPDEPLVWYELTGGPLRRYLHADHQGSVIASNDDLGNLVGLAAYDPWGIPNSTSITNVGRLGYTGQAWIPELGMWYYKARIYSPTLGRFLQTDPIGYEDQVNLYAYVGNDPVAGRDPTGTLRIVCNVKIMSNGTHTDCRFSDDGSDDTTIKYYMGGKLVWMDSVPGDGSENPSIAYRILDTIQSRVVTTGPWIETLTDAARQHQNAAWWLGGHIQTPATNPERFEAYRGPAKRDKTTGEIWVRDQLHKDHYEVYKNPRTFERGIRSREVWADGRLKGIF